MNLTSCCVFLSWNLIWGFAVCFSSSFHILFIFHYFTILNMKLISKQKYFQPIAIQIKISTLNKDYCLSLKYIWIFKSPKSLFTSEYVDRFFLRPKVLKGLRSEIVRIWTLTKNNGFNSLLWKRKCCTQRRTHTNKFIYVFVYMRVCALIFCFNKCGQ